MNGCHYLKNIIDNHDHDTIASLNRFRHWRLHNPCLFTSNLNQDLVRAWILDDNSFLMSIFFFFLLDSINCKERLKRMVYKLIYWAGFCNWVGPLLIFMYLSGSIIYGEKKKLTCPVQNPSPSAMWFSYSYFFFFFF